MSSHCVDAHHRYVYTQNRQPMTISEEITSHRLPKYEFQSKALWDRVDGATQEKIMRRRVRNVFNARANSRIHFALQRACDAVIAALGIEIRRIIDEFLCGTLMSIPPPTLIPEDEEEWSKALDRLLAESE